MQDRLRKNAGSVRGDQQKEVKDSAAHRDIPDDRAAEDDLPVGEDPDAQSGEGSSESSGMRAPFDGLFPPDEGAAERAELVAWLEKLADADDRHFTASEQAEIGREIEALHAEVKTLTELKHHQQEAIDQLLVEVQRGSERMGRKDWVTWAIGAATSLVIMEIVPPLALLHLAVHAIHALGHLLIADA